MDPLAAYSAAPVASPAIPAEWIASGVVTPVVGSPAAMSATAWNAQPVYVDPRASSGSMLDAISGAMFGIAPTGHGDAMLAQQQQIAAQQHAIAQQQALAHSVPQQQLSYVAAPTVPMPQLVSMSVPASGVATAQTDPTLISSASGAIAGFASATGRAIASVAGAGSSKAKRVGTELWAGVRSPRSIHVSQVPSKYNAAPAAGNRDCGPASVVMTLKLLGRTVPGASPTASPQRLINRVRQLAGSVSNAASTSNHELARAIRAAGAQTSEIADARSIRSAVMSGRPVILNGNPRNSGAYGRSFSSAQMAPYDGAHWIVVSGFDAKAGKFIINDPLSKVGPVKVTPTQLEAYRGGSLGIVVDG